MSDKYPADWVQMQVQKVISKSFCGHSPTCEERPIKSEKEWGILKTTAITWNGWNESAHKVPPPKYWENERTEVKEGDVLVTKAGPRHRVGVVVHVQSTKPHLMVSGKMIGLRPRQELVLPRILAAALSLRDPQVFLDHRSTGMAESQVNFNNDVLHTASIVLPTMPEQHAIVDILDTVDKAIQQTETVLAKLQQVKAGRLHDLLTYGLDENGELRDPIRHPEKFMDSPLGLIPEGWFSHHLRDVLIKKPSNGYSPKETASFSGFFVLGLGCLTADGFKASQLKPINRSDVHPENILHDGDLLLSRANTLQLVALPGIFRDIGYTCTYPDLMMRLAPKPHLLPQYLELVIRYSKLRNHLICNANGTSASMVKINAATVINSPIVYPDRLEQERVLESITSFNEKLTITELENEKLKVVKQGLMHDLLTGTVRVPQHLQPDKATVSDTQKV